MKYPRKQAVLMGQLADMLRSEGGLPYKEAIASTIITIIEDNPEAKEKGERPIKPLLCYSKMY